MSQPSFLKSVAKISAATVLGQGLLFLVAPVLTRIYSVEAMGALGVFSSFLSSIVIVGALGYEKAILVPSDSRKAASVVAVAGVATVASGALLAVVLLWNSAASAALLGSASLAPYLWILPISFVGAGIYQVASAWSIREKEFAAIAQTKVAQSVVQAVSQVGLRWLLPPPAGLLIGDALSRFAGGGKLLFASLPKLKLVAKGLGAGEIRASAREFIDYPRFTAPAALLHQAGSTLPILLVSNLYGVQHAGWLSLGIRMVLGPLALLGSAIAQVFTGHAAEMVRENPDRLKALFQKTATRLCLLGILPAMVLLFAGPAMFAFVFGPEWEQAGRYMQILAGAVWVQFVAGPIFPILQVLQAQRTVFWLDVVGFVAIVGGIFAVRRAGGPAESAVMVQAGGTALLYGSLGIAAWIAVRRLDDPEKVAA